MKIAEWYTGKDRIVYIKQYGEVTTFSFNDRRLNLYGNQEYIFNKNKKYSLVLGTDTVELHEEDR